MANTSNIAINSVSAISDIAINSVNIIEAHHWDGTTLNLVWAKGASATWITNADAYVIMAEYTPASNIQVSSFKMIENKGTPVYNYISGIYVKSTGAPVSNSVEVGTTNVSIVSDGTYLGENKYIHTKSYSAGSYPSLTSGVTYYFVCAERYTTYKALSGSNVGAQAYGWSLGQDTISGASALESNVYLEVIAV